MQFKTTMKYPFIPTRMAVIKVLDNDKCWKGCGEANKNLLSLLPGVRHFYTSNLIQNTALPSLLCSQIRKSLRNLPNVTFGK